MQEANSIAALRARAGLTQSELAQQLGVSENTIANWERGSASKWIRQLYKLCHLLHCSLDDLLSDEMPDEDECPLLKPRILDAVRQRCHALDQQDHKAAAKIASYATLHDPDLRYWLEQADSIRSPEKNSVGNETGITDCESVCNTLILQNLLNQLSSHPPDTINFQIFCQLVKPVNLTASFITRSAVFDKDRYQRNHILQTHSFSVYVIGWMPGQLAGMHHHGNALDAIQVIQGEMAYWTLTPEETKERHIPFEGGSEAPRVQGEPHTIVKAGERVFLDRFYAHQIANLSNQKLITLHYRFGLPPVDQNWSSQSEMKKQVVRWMQRDECILTIS